MQQWGGKIRRGVEEEKRRPRNLRRSGATQIAMTIAQSGGLISARISRSSGYEKLDTAAMNAVKAVTAPAPFVAAPDELPYASYKFVLKIVFQH